jgi:hypothetical protein
MDLPLNDPIQKLLPVKQAYIIILFTKDDEDNTTLDVSASSYKSLVPKNKLTLQKLVHSKKSNNYIMSIKLYRFVIHILLINFFYLILVLIF